MTKLPADPCRHKKRAAEKERTEQDCVVFTFVAVNSGLISRAAKGI